MKKRIYQIKESCIKSMQKCMDFTFSDMTLETIEGYRMFFFHGCNDRDSMEARAKLYAARIDRRNYNEVLCCYAAELPDYLKSKVAKVTLEHERVNVSYRKVGDKHFIQIIHHSLNG